MYPLMVFSSSSHRFSQKRSSMSCDNGAKKGKTGESDTNISGMTDWHHNREVKRERSRERSRESREREREHAHKYTLTHARINTDRHRHRQTDRHTHTHTDTHTLPPSRMCGVCARQPRTSEYLCRRRSGRVMVCMSFWNMHRITLRRPRSMRERPLNESCSTSSSATR